MHIRADMGRLKGRSIPDAKTTYDNDVAALGLAISLATDGCFGPLHPYVRQNK